MMPRTTMLMAVAAGCAISAMIGVACERPAHAQTTPTPASAIPVTAGGVPMVGPMLGPPRVTWLFSQGDANGQNGDSRVPQFVLDPIRLGLFAEAVPVGRADRGCIDSNEATGGATASGGGFAMQHATAFQLVPKLTLVGFGRGGCAFDGAVGGALVYATPIAKNIWFVASAGYLLLPHAGPGGTSTTRSQVRADIMFARPKGHSYSVGVSNRGVSFGGTL